METSSPESSRLRPRLALVVLLAALPAVVPVAGGTLRVYGPADGLPSVQNHAVVQDEEGFIWFAGPNGLARYDGQQTVVFGPEEGLSHQGLRALAVAPEGLLIGNDIGVDLMLSDTTIERLLPAQGRSIGGVEQIVRRADGTVWIAGSLGLARWHRDTGIEFDNDPAVRGHLVSAIAAGPRGVWIAGPTLGLLRHDGTLWREPDERDRIPNGSIVTLAFGPDDTLFVGGADGLMELDAGGRILRRLGGAGVSAVLPLADEIWVGRGDTLTRLTATGPTWHSQIVFEDVSVNDLVSDRQGNVWVASDDVGVVRVSAMYRAVRGLAAPSVPDGSGRSAPCKTQVFSIAPASDGALLVGGDRCSWRLDGAIPREMPWLRGVKVWDLQEDGEGVVWVAAENGIFRRVARTSRQIGATHPVLAAPGRCLLLREGEVWIGTRGGLAVVRDGAIEELVDGQGRGLGYVYTLVPDGEDRVWIGTLGRGLWLHEGGALRSVDAPGIKNVGNVYGVAIGRGRVAVLQDESILVSDGEDWRTLPRPTRDAVAGWAAVFGDDETLWVGGSSGLLALDVDSGAVRHRIGTGLGLPHEEFTTSRSLLWNAAGLLMGGTAGGLVAVDPQTVAELAQPPRVRLAGAEWRNAELDAAGTPLRVRSGHWILDLRLWAPWFLGESGLEFRSRLVGFDDEWQDGGAEPRLRFTGLPAGRYRLESQARSALGGWGPTETLFEFEVLPSPWRSPAALSAYALVLVLLIVGVWHWRNSRLIRRAEELKALVEERTLELTEANRALAHAAHIKDRTLATVSHDLRAPLGVLIGFVRLVRRGKTGKHSPEELLERMQRTSERMLDLVNDLLDVQLAESGHLELDRETLELDTFLQDVAATTGRLGEPKAIGFRCDQRDSGLFVHADRKRLRQVLDNLIGNAFKFSPPGTQVTLEAHRVGEGVEISVVDQGPGIPPGELETIFGAFERASTRPTGGEHGAGLGLAICKRLVELHGGKLGVDSAPGRGSRFYVVLPAVPRSEVATRSNAAPASAG